MSPSLCKKLTKLPEKAVMPYIMHCDVCPFFNDGAHYEYNPICNITGTIVKTKMIEGQERPIIPKDCPLEDC